MRGCRSCWRGCGTDVYGRCAGESGPRAGARRGVVRAVGVGAVYPGAGYRAGWLERGPALPVAAVADDVPDDVDAEEGGEFEAEDAEDGVAPEFGFDAGGDDEGGADEEGADDDADGEA